VHDELVISMPDTKEGKDGITELTHIMCSALKLLVPLTVDVKIGDTWNL
jgi:DNA polymerase I-like protein with 3'-5' exonuclease and polymerase domains